MEPRSMLVAMAQVEGHQEPRKNVATAQRFIARASGQGARLIVFPEMFMALPRKNEPLVGVSETMGGPFTSALGKLARDYDIHVVAGIWEPSDEADRVKNTAVVLAPEGEPVAAYRKLHLFDALQVHESKRMVPGNEAPPLVDIDGYRVGVAICYDLRFPELFRDLALRGADLVVVPSAWYGGPLKEDHWLTLLRARAIENTMYVAGVNLSGSAFCGRSALFDPFGVAKAGAGEYPELVVADIDGRRLREVRDRLPTLRHIRTDIYRFRTQRSPKRTGM